VTARDFLAAVQQRADAATGGPWTVERQSDASDVNVRHMRPDDEPDLFVACTGDPHYDGTVHDAEFIAASRTDVPRLVAALTAALDLHQPLPSSVSALYPEPLCECGATYPCPTVRVITDALTPKENDS
jgi:hypothetical protein